MKTLISSILVLALLVSSLVATGCGRETEVQDKPYEHKEEHTKVIGLSGQTQLILKNTNGAIHIDGSDTIDKIHIEMTKRVKSYSLEDAAEHVDDIVITVEERPQTVYVEVEHPMTTDRDYGAAFSITLPTHFDFEITVGNGNIEIYNVESTKTKAGVGNGYIGVNMTLMDSSSVNFEVGNGNILADITVIGKCSMDFRVGNGDITLKIPDNISTEVKASVGNGEVTASGLTFQNSKVSRTELEGTLGEGKNNIVLSVGNGDIQLQGQPTAAAQES